MSACCTASYCADPECYSNETDEEYEARQAEELLPPWERRILAGTFETEHGTIDVEQVSWGNGTVALLESFEVWDGHRGQGHGRRILEAVIEGVTAKHGLDLILQVWQDNTPALRLYESLGFVVTKEWESTRAVVIRPLVIEWHPRVGLNMRRPARTLCLV